MMTSGPLQLSFAPLAKTSSYANVRENYRAFTQIHEYANV